MDFEAGELRPAFIPVNLKLSEVEQSTTGRAASGYVVKNNRIAMLPYTDEEYIVNNLASSTESINPYDNFTFVGSVILNPPGDVWYDQTVKPLVYKDDTGTYDTLIPDSVGEATYGSIWNSWKQVWYSPTNTDKVKAIDGGAVITSASVSGSASSVVFPYLRSATINFTGNKLKPNTKLFVFFNEYNVTPFCYSANTTANVVASFVSDEFNQSNIITDSKGTVSGVFNFDIQSTGLRIPAGKVNFRLTDSVNNGSNKETFADAVYVANGTLSKVEPPRVVYTPPAIYAPSPSSGLNVGVGGTTVALVGSTTTTSGSGTSEISGNTGSSSSSTATVTNGLAEHAASFLKGISLDAVTEQDSAKYAGYYNTALVNAGVTEATFVTQIATAPLDGTGYRSGANDKYEFKGAPDLSYRTATNILEARNGVTGDLFIADVRKKVEEPYWNQVVIPLFEGTKAAITEAVFPPAGVAKVVSADQQKFWDTGVANGSFPNTTEGIHKAIAAYAAASTLAVIEAPATNKAVANTVVDGLRGTRT
jgi:hypothetical protein